MTDPRQAAIRREQEAAVIKAGQLARRSGLIFYSYRAYTVYLLDNGQLQFYRDGREDISLRIQLDESLRVVVNSTKKSIRFTIRLNKNYHFECAINDDWVDQLQNLTIKKM